MTDADDRLKASWPPKNCVVSCARLATAPERPGWRNRRVTINGQPLAGRQDWSSTAGGNAAPDASASAASLILTRDFIEIADLRLFCWKET